MKKTFVIALLILMPVMLICSTWTVKQDDTGDFTTIQSAIINGNVSDNDIIEVYYYPGDSPYGTINLGTRTLAIEAYTSHTPIIRSSTGNVVNMGTGTGSSLSGFEITTTSTASGVKILGNSSVTIEDCEFDGLDKAIEIYDQSGGPYPNVTIENCIFTDNIYGIYTDDNPSYNAYNINVDVIECKFYDGNTDAIYINGCNELYVFASLFYDNTSAFDMSSRTVEADIDRCTITENTTGFDWCSYDYFNITNSIVYDNTANFTGTAADLDINYSCIEGGNTQNGNTTNNPYFCSEYPYEYYLMEGSPCIDTGNSTATGGDVRLDMGCFETYRDIKECEGQSWNWVSYPRLYRTGNGSVDVVPLLEDFLDWNFDLEMLFKQVVYLDPILAYNELAIDWTPDDYDVQSSLGYKLYPDDSGDHYLPTVNNASRLSASHILDATLLEDDDCWLGYWLPYTQNIEDAFGSLFDYVVSVDAEDWYYEFSKHETPSSSTTNKNMVYGKGYVVVFDKDIEDFSWTDATGRSIRTPGAYRPDPEYFTFADLPNYEAIDILEIPANVVEIGVYEDDICIGAIVVQNEAEQLLAYTTNVNRSQVPLSFEVVTNSRQGSQQVASYEVMNKETGKYENRPLISGQQKSSMIMFGELEEPQNNPPVMDEVALHNNYPNPFNPTTNISFSLPLDQVIQLNIYNMKGQIVRGLVSGQFTSGEHSVAWNGKDENGKSVGSGLYFYKLITSNKIISKKMLLLK